MSHFHKKCNGTIRKFFEDFDQLPYELKEIIWNQPQPPTFDDLKAAWQLAEEMGHTEENVHVLRKDRKEQKARDRKAAREAKRAEVNLRRMNLRRSRYRTIYKKVRIDKRDDKHARLVRLLPEEAMEVMARRNHVDDIEEATGWKWIPVGRAKVTDNPEEAVEYFESERPPQSLSKMMHNAVGRTGDSDIEQLANVSKKQKT